MVKPAWLATGAMATDASDRPDPTNARILVSSTMVRMLAAARAGSSASSNSWKVILAPLSGPPLIPPPLLTSSAASLAPALIWSPVGLSAPEKGPPRAMVTVWPPPLAPDVDLLSSLFPHPTMASAATASTAASRFLMRSPCSDCSEPAPCGHAPRRDQEHGDQQTERHDVLEPRREVSGDEALEDAQRQPAEQRPLDPARPSQDGGHEALQGGLPTEGHEDLAEEGGEQGAGHAGDGPRHRVGGRQRGRHRDADQLGQDRFIGYGPHPPPRLGTADEDGQGDGQADAESQDPPTGGG